MIIVVKLMITKTLFKMEDSLTPTLRSNVNNMTIVKAKKSGYSDKNGTSIGKYSLKVSPIALLAKLSI